MRGIYSSGATAMRRANVAALTALAILITAAPWADAYKWRDESGRIHYGDQALDDSGRVLDNQDVQSIETYECGTEACRAEEEQLAREAAQRHAQTLQWLESVQQEKLERKSRDEEVDDERFDDEESDSTAYPPATAPPVWPFGLAPGVN